MNKAIWFISLLAGASACGSRDKSKKVSERYVGTACNGEAGYAIVPVTVGGVSYAINTDSHTTYFDGEEDATYESCEGSLDTSGTPSVRADVTQGTILDPTTKLCELRLPGVEVRFQINIVVNRATATVRVLDASDVVSQTVPVPCENYDHEYR